MNFWVSTNLKYVSIYVAINLLFQCHGFLSQTPSATDYYSTLLNNSKIREDMIFPYSSKVQKFLFILVLRKHECTMTQSIKRPYGITIIAILAIVGGMVVIFGGLSSLVSGAFIAVIPIEDVMTQLQQQEKVQQQTQNLAELHDLIQLLGSSSVVLGTVVMVIGIGYLIVSYGLLKGREWDVDYHSGTYNYISCSPNSIYYNNKHA